MRILGTLGCVAGGYGSTGTGNSTHFGMEPLKIVTQIDILHVPYKGTGAALTDLLGKHIVKRHSID